MSGRLAALTPILAAEAPAAAQNGMPAGDFAFGKDGGRRAEAAAYADRLAARTERAGRQPPGAYDVGLGGVVEAV